MVGQLPNLTRCGQLRRLLTALLIAYDNRPAFDIVVPPGNNDHQVSFGFFTFGFIVMAGDSAQGLTPEQLAFFNENGYLLIPDALSQDTVKELLEDTNTMLNDFPLDDHPMTKFSTGGDDGADHVGDAYFLESGDKVRFFFEEGMNCVEIRHWTAAYTP